MNWDISHISGAVVTHSHNDHSKSVKAFKGMGIPVWLPYEEPKKYKKMGNFDVYSFDVPHSVPCFGFYIMHRDTHFEMLYATDYEYIKYRFNSYAIDTFLIECNHISELVDKAADNYEHIHLGHSDLETVKSFVASSKTVALSNIILCHLSSVNADASRMTEEIKSLVGDTVNVTAASPGREVVLVEQ